MNALAYSFLSQRQGILGKAEDLLIVARSDKAKQDAAFDAGDLAEAARHAQRRQIITRQLAALTSGPRGSEVRELLKSIGGR